MSRKFSYFVAATPLALILGCSGSNVSTPPGSTDAGGGSSVGGTEATGGAAAGGNAATGGAPTTGGVAAAGGAPSTGGVATTGGAAIGGAAATGGASPATGGKASVGGSSTTGGAASTTGGAATGGAGAGTGGAITAGGAAGSCGRTVGTCTAPTVKITDVAVGSAVTGYGGEGDTAVIPMALASLPSGGSRLAWMGTDSNVHIAQLDCNDALVGTPFTLPAVDLEDIIADDNGGVVLLTRNATNGGTDQCGTVRPLCGGTSSPCRTMWMVRFDNTGAVTWQTQVTNLSTTQAGYQDGAFFVWWYQHHGRLAFSGTNYAAIFGVAITVNNTVNGVACIDIHEGDRLQVVSSAGALVSAGSLAFGESHAWTSRILWDSRTSKFVSTDATDDNCRIVSLPGATATTTTLGASTCDGTLFNGDVVKSTTAGYWNAWTQGNAIKIAHFTTGAPDTTIANAGASQHPHLVAYGASNMLLTWATSTTATSMNAQVRAADTTAATIGAQFTIAVSDHDYMGWKSYSDGSVAYAASGANSTSVKIARVMPCQ